MKTKTISVCKNLIFVGNKGEIKPSPKTDAGNRVLPIPSVLFETLKEYLPTVESIYVFPSASNKLMSEAAFRRFWDKITNRLNLAAGGKTKGKLKVITIADDITPHIFRHTYATSLYYAGVDVKTAQYLLGHSSIEMTLGVYTHLEAGKNYNVVSKLDDYFSRNINQSEISQ